MTVAQGLVAIIVFWAIIGGLGASLLLPAMQSLIHGNFEGTAQKKVYALVGAGRRHRRRRRGPLIGGFITTYLSWRVAFLLEAVVIAVVLSGIGLVRDVAVHRPAGRSTWSAPPCPSWAWAASCSASWCGRRAASRCRADGRRGRRLGGLVWWLLRRKRRGEPALLDPDLFDSAVPLRHLRPDAPAGRAGRHDDRPADLPADGAGVRRHGGGPVDRPALAQHVRRGAPGREAGGRGARRHHPCRVRPGGRWGW